MTDKKARVEPIVGLIHEIYMVYGSLRSLFGTSNSKLKLASLEVLTLGAVVEQQTPPTVAQVGRLSGYSRQAIQRAANALVKAGLIKMIDNPNHKRAPLLVATPQGEKIKVKAETAMRLLSTMLADEFEPDRTRHLLSELRTIRDRIDSQSDALIAKLPH